jgi:Skp family chaperone for outer membrane proteins
MKNILCAGAAIALSVALATPAAAQVNGIGVINPAAAVLGTKALGEAYGSINTTYASELTQLQQVQQQRQTLMRQFDTDQDGRLSEEESAAAQANATAVQQLQSLNETIATQSQPISLAQIYVVEQIATQYGAALQQVMTQKNVQILLEPGAIVYAPDEAILTDDVIAVLDTLVPTVSATVPDGWGPQQQSFELWQQVQELISNIAAIRQAQQQQAQPAAPAVQGR